MYWSHRTDVKSSDMPKDMQRKALDIAKIAIHKYQGEKDVASYIKRDFDRTFDSRWQCIVGRNFGR